MKTTTWTIIDDIAHFLYCPTMLGRRAGRARWHHRIHLIPGALLSAVCRRLDEADRETG